ncbi:hypothetical protein CBM2633_U10122 [Cupriavidus taiwanensis]|nr:hypothetical protein CBM2633_U10122 [Cupriavidus taiwanensis]
MGRVQGQRHPERLRQSAGKDCWPGKGGGDQGTTHPVRRETKHLSWPASYGQSPWEAASTVGATLDASLKGGPVSAYSRGIIYVFERTVSALAAMSDRENLTPPQRPKMRM